MLRLTSLAVAAALALAACSQQNVKTTIVQTSIGAPAVRVE